MQNGIQQLSPTEMQALDKLAALVHVRAGIQLGSKQYAMMHSRLTARLSTLNFETYGEYLNHIQNVDPQEEDTLVALLTTHHTFFFREFFHFEFLRDEALPHLIQEARKRGDRKIKIWCSACSRGPEVYSLGMFLNYHLQAMAPDVGFHIVGTDIDSHSVEFAINGVFNKKDIKEIPAQYRANNWQFGTGEIRDYVKIHSKIKKNCNFGVDNLLAPNCGLVKNESFDVIFCRNALIYFSEDQIETIVSNLNRHLDTEGFLFVGITEGIGSHSKKMRSLGKSIFTKQESTFQTKSMRGVNTLSILNSEINRNSPPTIVSSSSENKIEVMPSIPKILVVDDSKSIHMVLKRILTKETGFEIADHAYSAEEAHKLIQDKKYDAITLDIQMEPLTGIQYLEKYFNETHPPVVMVTAVSEEDKQGAQKAMSLGAFDYVEKPSLENMNLVGDQLRTKLKLAIQAKIDKTRLNPKPVEMAPTERDSDFCEMTISKNRNKDENYVIESNSAMIIVRDLQRPQDCVSGWIKQIEDIKNQSQNLISKISNVFKSNYFSDPKLSAELLVFGKRDFVEKISSEFRKDFLRVKEFPLGASSLNLRWKQDLKKFQVSDVVSGATNKLPNLTVVRDEISSANLKKKTKVLIVDDSKSVRVLLEKIFSQQPDIEVVASLENPLDVKQAIRELKPNVMTLDLHMPHMNGVELLKSLTPLERIPTVLITALSMQEGSLVFDALEAGAVDYIQKPSIDNMNETMHRIVEIVRTAAQTQTFKRNKSTTRSLTNDTLRSSNTSLDESKIVAIGSSTGGTEALKDILTQLPAKIPPILIVQHIPPVFSKALADRLSNLCPFKVVEGVDGQLIKAGTAYIAPGGKQMGVKYIGKDLHLSIDENLPTVNRHKPSVDYLFESLAKLDLGKSIYAAILTGMGNDGAKGLLALKNAGALTIAQDEASCVVFGMPKEAIKLGAAKKILALNQISDDIISELSRGLSRTA